MFLLQKPLFWAYLPHQAGSNPAGSNSTLENIDSFFFTFRFSIWRRYERERVFKEHHAEPSTMLLPPHVFPLHILEDVKSGCIVYFTVRLTPVRPKIICIFYRPLNQHQQQQRARGRRNTKGLHAIQRQQEQRQRQNNVLTCSTMYSFI